MTTLPLGVGIIGTGPISMTHLRNAALFPGLRLELCHDAADGLRAGVRGRQPCQSAASEG